MALESAESIHVDEICKNFQALGVNVTLYSLKAPKHIKSSYTFVQLWTPPFLKYLFYQIFIVPILIAQWTKRKPDAVYFRVSPTLILPIILAKLYRIPIYAEINGTIRPELEKSPTTLGHIQLFFHVSDFVERTVYRSAKKIFTVTDSLKEYLIRTYGVLPEKIVVVENGVDSDTLQPALKKNTSSTITIGYVGGLMWWQGMQFVVDAFAQPVLKNTNISFILYGDGPERVTLEKQAKELGLSNRIEFRGAINHENVASAINSFDICIAYYVKARGGLNSPFKIYEYLSCGKPTIVSDIQGSADTFKDVSLVVPAEDPVALAVAIHNLANDSKLRQKLGVKARKYILDGHTWKETASKILAVIKEQN